jgi:predicted AAA+ superfamily ATPase
MVDGELDELIAGGAAAVALVGAKAVGKSATAAERATTVFAFDDSAVRAVVESDPEQLHTDGCILIDEWQRVPESWDIVRRAVDAGAPAGRYLLTGSAWQPNPGTHSGAGRILVVRMRPMSLAERGLAEPTVSLAELLEGNEGRVEGRCAIRLPDYVDEILGSGFPGIRSAVGRVRRAQLAGYVDRVVDRDVPDLGRAVRNPAALRRWLRAYAAATATTASFETIRDAATSGASDKPARSTVIPYRDALERLYVLDELPAWSPSTRPINQLATAGKHHLVDPALAASLLEIRADDLLSGAGTRTGKQAMLGPLFESFVTQSVRIYAEHNEWSVGHLRTHRGEREVDLVVGGPGGFVALEVKLTATVDDDDVRDLKWLRDRLGGQLRAGVVVTTGADAYRRRDGIVVVPAALLGP